MTLLQQGIKFIEVLTVAILIISIILGIFISKETVLTLKLFGCSLIIISILLIVKGKKLYKYYMGDEKCMNGIIESKAMENGIMEREIGEIISNKVNELNRPDLYRQPLVSFSSADDERYDELKELIGEWHLTPSEFLPDAKSVISYFVPFTKDVVKEPKKMKDGSPLWGEAYQEINRHFNVINEAVSDYLTDLGYSAITIKPTHTYDPKDLKSMWSHRSAAVIAELGDFGANKLIITEKGSGGRFCTVITSAVLKTDKAPVETKCLYIKNGTCGLCFKICPVKALSAEAIDKFACQDELNKNEILLKETTRMESADVCGKCISICPFAYIE